MPRLIHLNGPPGIGKSTIARHYCAAHPGVLCCDVDVLRSLIGGWESNYQMAGALIRPAALAMITEYLRGGHDVVLPQLLYEDGEISRFGAAASEAGADFIELMLMADKEAAIARFHRRGRVEDAQAWHVQVRGIVAQAGGDEMLAQVHDSLAAVVRTRGVQVVESVEGAPDQTLAAVVTVLDREPGE